jgi:hypothetical protein
MVGQERMMILLADKSLGRVAAECEPGAYARTVRLTQLLSDHLPRLPWFMREVHCALEDGSTHLERVVEMLRIHPTVCDNFVRIGSLAEPAEPIRLPLDHLVVLMGKQRTWSAAVASFVLSEISSPWSSLTQKEVAGMALKAASSLLNEARELDDVEPEQSFVKGVLSICGLLPLIDSCGLTGRVPEWMGTSPEAVQLQRDLFDTDFVELNCWIQMIWRVAAEFPFATPVQSLETATKDRSIAVAAPVSDPASRNLAIVPRGN